MEGYRSVKSCYRSPNDGILEAHIAQVAVSFRDKKKKKKNKTAEARDILF